MKTLTDISIPTNTRPPKKKTRFWVDNEILEIYGTRLKAQGISLYNALARHANSETQFCFPSYPRLMQLSGIGKRNTISKYLKIIEKLGLIIIVRNKKREPNFYFLIDPLNIKTPDNQTFVIRKVYAPTKKTQTQYPNSTTDSTERDTLNQITKSNKEVGDSSSKEEKETVSFKDFFKDNPPNFLKGRGDSGFSNPRPNE